MRISVCIPLYNGADSIRNALQSLVGQSRKPDEVIVVDDCSTDEGLAVFDDFKNDLPLRIFRNEQNLGMVKNWNACLAKATGDIITFLHQDDGYFAEFLATAEKEFKSNPEIGFWACMGKHILDKGQPTPKFKGEMKPEKIAELVYLWLHIPPPTTVAFRRVALDKVGHYNNFYRYVGEPDLYFRLAEASYCFKQSEDVLVWRSTPANRASETFGLSPLYFDEWLKFLEDWSGHKILISSKESGQKALELLVDMAGRRIVRCLAKRKFRSALEIFKTIYRKTPKISTRVGASWELLFKKLLFSFSHHFFAEVFRQLMFIPGRIYRKTLRILRAVKRKKQYQLADLNFKNQLAEALADGASNDRAALRRLFADSSIFDLWSYYLCGPHYEMPWSGKQMSKLPMDYWIYRDLIERTKPDIILEIGTQRGVSALMLAEIGRMVGAHIVTIDILSPPVSVLQEFSKAGVSFILGNATEKTTVEEILSLAHGKKCLVIDDGSHLKSDVLKTFHFLKELVPVGGFYIIEDGFSNWLIEKKSHAALEAVDQILENNLSFKQCDLYDKFIFFSAFQGILERVSNDI